jgi:PhnB protein
MRMLVKLHPHLALAFNGQCEAAFKLYEQCFNGTIVFMLTWGNSPMAAEAPKGWESKIYHATLKIGDAVIAGGDVAPDRYATPKGFSVIVDMDDPALAERAFQALSDQGTVDMPLQETFWAARFGAVTDRFGVPWSINCEK